MHTASRSRTSTIARGYPIGRRGGLRALANLAGVDTSSDHASAQWIPVSMILSSSLWILLFVVAAVAIVALVVRIIGSSDEAQIRSTINQFAAAVDHNDVHKVLSYMCAEEAAQMTEGDGAVIDGDAVEPTTHLPVNVTDIHVTGDSATAQLSRPPQPARTLHLKKEAGTWKLCDPGPS